MSDLSAVVEGVEALYGGAWIGGQHASAAPAAAVDIEADLEARSDIAAEGALGVGFEGDGATTHTELLHHGLTDEVTRGQGTGGCCDQGARLLELEAEIKASL